MTQPEFTQPSPIDPQEILYSQVEAYINERRVWIGDAVELLSGDRESAIEDVLPLPTKHIGEVRQDTPKLDLSPEKELGLREIAGRFGLGASEDVTMEQQGLTPGYMDLKEAGLVWKVAAEADLPNPGASTIIYVGSTHVLSKPDELTFQTEILGVDPTAIVEGQTQYDAAKIVAAQQEGFKPLEEPEVLPFGYEVAAGNAFTTEPTRQLLRIGTQDGKDVLLLRIDQVNFEDGSFKFRPDAATQMRLVSEYLTAKGDTEKAIGMSTSTTYASRVIDTVRAGLLQHRQFGVAMYGRKTLAKVKQTTVAEPTSIDQIPSELGVMGENLDKLSGVLADLRQSKIAE